MARGSAGAHHPQCTSLLPPPPCPLLLDLPIDELDRERNAIENWNHVLNIDPQNLEALWALRDLYERASEPNELTQTIESLLSLIDEHDERRLELSVYHVPQQEKNRR